MRSTHENGPPRLRRSEIGRLLNFGCKLERTRTTQELHPQIERNDRGNSNHRVLDTYMRMLAEYRRVMDGRERGHSRYDYLLSAEELEKISAASVYPSNRAKA